MERHIERYPVGPESEYKELRGNVTEGLGLGYGKILCVDVGRPLHLKRYSGDTEIPRRWIVPGIKVDEHLGYHDGWKVVDVEPVTDPNARQRIEEYLKGLEDMPVIIW